MPKGIMDIIIKALEHSPDLLAIIIVVFIFLKFLDKMLASHSKRTDEFIATVKELHSEGLAQRDRIEHAMEANTVQLTRNTLAMDHMSHVVERCNHAGMSMPGRGSEA